MFNINIQILFKKKLNLLFPPEEFIAETFIPCETKLAHITPSSCNNDEQNISTELFMIIKNDKVCFII